MTRLWVVAIGLAAMFGRPASGGPAAPVPSNLLVDVSISPYPNGSPVLVPGDRSDKPAFVAEIFLLNPSTKIAYGHKRLAVFSGEPAQGTFSADDLSVDYRIRIDTETGRAETEVRARRGEEFVCGSRGTIWLGGPPAGVQPAPRK